jgi:hypothetical protein
VAAFGRANFKLDVHTVSVSLQACFGGKASQFQVTLLHGRVFRFVVASRSIGFEIYNSCYGGEVVQIGNLRRKNIICSKIRSGFMFKD